MQTFNRLKVPTFDLTWLNFKADCYVIMPGGGGSARSGVRNQLLIGKYKGLGSYEFMDGYMTDLPDRSALCSGVATGTIQNTTVICALLDNVCAVLTVTQDATTGELSVERQLEFCADFSSKDNCVNCCVVMCNDCIATGGEDGDVRVWKISVSDDAGDWKVELISAMKGHAGPVMSLDLHSPHNWICSASRDGSVRVWDGTSQTLMSAMDLRSAANKNDKIESRGACFSKCGQFVYAIHSTRKGCTYLKKLRLLESAVSQYSLTSVTEVVAAKVPSTRLKIDDRGDHLALGCSDGAVCIFDAVSLRKILSMPCHDLPVTGLGFVPYSEEEEPRFASCSADNKLLTVVVKRKFQVNFQVLMVCFVGLLAVLLAYFSANVVLLH